MISLGIANVLGRSAVGLGSGSTTIASVVSALIAAGRKGVLPPPQDISRGMFWRDRNRTQPYTEADKERTVEFVDDLTGNPVGWQLGPNTWNDSQVSTVGESQVLGGGRFRLYSSAGALSTVTMPVGTIQAKKSYLIRFFIESVAVAGTGIQFMDFGTVTSVSTGWKTLFLPANSPNLNSTAFLKRSSAMDVVISNVSLQEVILDESWLGPNLVTNGDFSNGTTAWTNSSTGTGTFSVSGGAATISGSDGANRGSCRQPVAMVVGRCYQLNIVVSACTGIHYFAGTTVGTGGVLINAAGTYSIPFAATASDFIAYTSSGGGSITFDNITVREIPGHPIVSAVAGSGLVLSRRVNLLQRTEQVTHGAWARSSTGSGVASIATQTGSTFRADFNCGDLSSSSNRSWLTQSGFGTTIVGATYRVRFQLRAATPADVGRQIRWAVEGIGGWNGVLTLAADWSTFSMVGPAATSTATLNLLFETRGTFTNSAAASAEFREVDVRFAFWDQFPGIPSYQRVNDGTAGVLDYDDNPAFPLHWRNVTGTQAMMTLGTVDMSAGDAGAIIAGLVKTSDAGGQMIAETSASAATNAGSMYLFVPSGGTGYNVSSRGSQQSATSNTGTPAPDTASLVFEGRISTDTLRLHRNGSQVINGTADQGTGNLGNHRFNIAGRDVGGTASLRFTGILLHLPVLVAADAGLDLQALAREYAASAGFIY